MFDDPYKLDQFIGVNCPITGFKLLYKGIYDSKLRFQPLDGPVYLEYTVSILDYLSGKYVYSISYGRIEDFILGKGRLKRDLGMLLFEQAKNLCNLFKINKRKRAFILNDNVWESLVYVPYVGYVSSELSEEEIQILIAKDKEEYEKKIKEGSSYRRMEAKLVPPESVEVKPIPPPSGNIFYIDFKYKS